MKFLILALACIMSAHADVPELGYSYQQPAAPVAVVMEPQKAYIPPNAAAPASAPVNAYETPQPAAAAAVAAPVNSYVPPEPVNSYVPPPAAASPVNSYVPPEPVAPQIEQVVNTYVPPAPVPQEQPISEVEAIEQTPDDGYQYKTVRRVVYRHRA